MKLCLLKVKQTKALSCKGNFSPCFL